MGISAGDRDIDRAVVYLCAEPAQGDLQRGRLEGVGHQAVGQSVRAPVGCSGSAHPEVRQSRAAEILDQRQGAGAKHVHGGHGEPALRKRTDIPGTSKAGSGRSTSHSSASVRPMSCHPPGDSRG